MQSTQKILLISICGIFLFGCQGNKTKPDSNSYTLATNSESGLQRTKYVPVPMPGQLMSLKKNNSSKR